MAAKISVPGERPECYGDPGRVCPKSEDGFIEPQADCVNCRWIQDCLRKALEKSGVVRTVAQKETPVSGVVGFVKRWSDRKLKTARK